MALHPTLRFEQPALREVSLKIAKVGGVNLGQGVCRMPTPEVVLQGASEALLSGKNLYCPAAGIPELREALALRLNKFNGIPCKAENVLIVPGSTGAFEAFCQAYLKSGDEVVTFSPFYPYHHNLFLRKGIKVHYIPLTPPSWEFDPKRLREVISPRVKFILVNTPNNPTGKVFSSAECELIAEVCTRHEILCVTDEVYEYMTYDAAEHTSMASLPGMFERTVTIGSYSKTFAITGWRIGYLQAPLNIVEGTLPFVDNIYVCAPTPLQYGVLKGITELKDNFYRELLNEYTKKRALMFNALQAAGMNPHSPPGAYYMIADISKRWPGKTSEEISDLLIEKAKVGAVPASDFVGFEAKGDPKRSNFLRFCYAVPDQMLHQAAENLKGMG